MFNMKTHGCLHPSSRGGSGHYLDMFYVYAASSSETDRYACHRNSAISQTCWGGLSTIHKTHTCAVPKTYELLANNKGIETYIALTNCNNTEDKHFNFGKFFSRFIILLYITNTTVKIEFIFTINLNKFWTCQFS